MELPAPAPPPLRRHCQTHKCWPQVCCWPASGVGECVQTEATGKGHRRPPRISMTQSRPGPDAGRKERTSLLCLPSVPGLAVSPGWGKAPG